MDSNEERRTTSLPVLSSPSQQVSVSVPRAVSFQALRDPWTTVPGALLILLPYLIQRHVVPADLGDVIQQLLNLLCGGVLLGTNTKQGKVD
jgi:hypothetical protein